MISLFELLTLLLFPLWAFLFHAFGMRISLIRKLPSQASTLLLALVISFVVTFVIGYREFSWERVSFALVCSLGLAHVYFHIFNMSETARRIRILVGLELNSQIVESNNYDPKEAVAVRIERLRSLNQISEPSPGYFLAKPSLLLYVSVILQGYENFLFPDRKRLTETSASRA